MHTYAVFKKNHKFNSFRREETLPTRFAILANNTLGKNETKYLQFPIRKLESKSFTC